MPSFTALMALALGVGILVTWNAARRAKLPPGDVVNMVFVGILVGVVAARALYVSDNWAYFRDHTDQMTQLWLGGLAWHGGLIGGAIGAALFGLWRKLNVQAAFDALTPGLMAGASLGWIGCYLAGVAYGRQVFPSDRWWFLAADLPDIYGLWNPRFATQLIGAVWAVVCFVCAAIANKVRKSPSQKSGARPSTFVAALALYSAGMFLLGFARGDTVPMLGTWRYDQVMDVVITIAGVAYLCRPMQRLFILRPKES